jgi:hypothetical protein
MDLSTEWDSKAALESLVAETIDVYQGDTVKHAEMILHDNVALAALMIVHTIKHSPDEKKRLEASKYLIERVIGKAGEGKNAGDDVLQSLLNEAIAQVSDGEPKN